MLVTVWFQGSKLGYYLQAIREDQDAANSLGIPLTLYKNVALMISAIFTAWAGALYGLYVGFIDPQTAVGLDISVQIVLTAIIGGIGTILGPVVGAALLVALSEALRSNVLTDLLVGSGLVGRRLGHRPVPPRQPLPRPHAHLRRAGGAHHPLHARRRAGRHQELRSRKRRSRAAAGGAR